MRRTLFRALAVTLLVLTTVAAWGGADQEARTIVAKGIKAAGGEEALAKCKAMTWTEKGTYHGMGAGLPYTGKFAVQWPSQFSMEIEGVFQIVLDGDKGWMKSGDGVKELPKDELAAQIKSNRAGWISSLLPLKDKAFQLKLLGDAKVGADATSVVEVSRKDYPTVKLYFAKNSGLLVKTEYRTTATDLGNKEVTMEGVYSDYKDVGGVKISHKSVMHRDGQLFVESEMTEVRPVGKLDAKVFAKPGV